MSLCGERARQGRDTKTGGNIPPPVLSLFPHSRSELRLPVMQGAPKSWNEFAFLIHHEIRLMKFTMQVRIPDPDWYKSIWKHTGTLGNTPCGHCRPPSCRGKMYTQHGESGTPWNLLNNFPSCTLADSHTDKYINLLSHYNDCPTFTILRVESLAALGRSRQSFSQFCSNFSSGHFAAQEGKAAHNIWRKKDKEEEGRSNSEFHRIGQTGGWLTPQEEDDNSESF